MVWWPTFPPKAPLKLPEGWNQQAPPSTPLPVYDSTTGVMKQIGILRSDPVAQTLTYHELTPDALLVPFGRSLATMLPIMEVTNVERIMTLPASPPAMTAAEIAEWLARAPSDLVCYNRGVHQVTSDSPRQ